MIGKRRDNVGSKIIPTTAGMPASGARKTTFWKKLLLNRTGDDAHEFKPILAEIEERPANPAGRLLLWVVLTFVTIFIFAMSFIEVDVVIRAAGKIVPVGDVKTFQPLETGVVKRLNVTEGDFVSKGATLVELDATTDVSELKSRERNLYLAEFAKKRIDALLQGHVFDGTSYSGCPEDIVASQAKLYSSQRSAYLSSLSEKEKELEALRNAHLTAKQESDKIRDILAIVSDEENRMRELFVVGAVPENRYKEKTKEVLELRRQFDAKSGQIRENLIRIEKLEKEIVTHREAFREKLLSELAEQIKDASQLSAEVSNIKFKQEKRLIVAPFSGYVYLVPIKTEGGVVSPAQPLISIVPENATLQIVALVSNKDIGFIREGQRAIIKVETYDFQKYGTIGGRVKSVSAFNIEDKESQLNGYQIYVTLDTNKLKDKNGNTYFIKPGMSVAVEINTGVRKVMEFILFPIIKHLDEGLKVR